MKILAIFLLLTFSGTILVPVAMSLTKQNQISLFIVDEEKGSNASQFNEIKEEKKDFNPSFPFLSIMTANSTLLTVVDHHNSLLPPTPCLEYVAPPPNVC